MKLCNEIDKCVIESIVDGDGLRIVIFLQGCTHHCPNCHNIKTWDINKGVTYSITDVYNYLANKLNEGYFDGITFSGGDPILQNEELNELIIKLRENFKNINIWLYTGFEYEKIKDMPILKNIDVLVDGKYEMDKMFPKKKFRGSYNQRLLHLKDGLIIEEE